MPLELGEKLPNFALPTDEGGTLTHTDLEGKTTVLYFYPRDDTPGCTTEAKDFTAALPEFTRAGVTVVGISADDIESHRKFKQKHGLALTLVTDTDKELAQALGVWGEKSMYGKKFMGMERATFLIDKHGVVRKAWRKVKVNGHVSEVLREAGNLAVASGTDIG